MPKNPQVYFDKDNYRLDNLNVREEPVPLHAEVDDKRDPKSTWQITAVLFRLVVFQDIKTEFTDPGSFSVHTLKFPMPGSAQATANDLSQVDLSELLVGKYAKYVAAGMGPWELIGQHLVSTDGVFYTLTTRLSARSNIAWDTTAFRKVKLPAV